MRYIIFTILSLLQVYGFTQSTGDYQSKQSGNWSDIVNWQYFNGTNWVDATNYPSFNDGKITIKHNISYNISALEIDEVVINLGATLTVDNVDYFTLRKGTDVDLKIYGTLQWNKGWAGNCATWEVFKDGIANINCGGYGTGCNTWNINSGGTMNFLKVYAYLNACTINNEGTINFKPDWVGYYVRSNTPSSPGIINNKTMGVINVITAPYGFGIGSDGNNAIEKNIQLNNEGKINIADGSNLLYAGNTDGSTSFNNTGVIDVGSGAVFTNSGIFNLNGGKFTGTGKIVNTEGWRTNVASSIPSTITLDLGSGYANYFGGSAELTINGIVNILGRISNQNYSSDVARVKVSSTGIANLTSYNALYLNNAIFTNEGTFNLLPITGNTSIDLSNHSQFINNGTIKISGTATSSVFCDASTTNTFTNNRTIDISNNSNLYFNPYNYPLAVFNNTATSIIKGEGAFISESGFLNAGNIEPGNNIGQLTFNGSAQPLQNNSNLKIEIDNDGTKINNDKLIRNADIILSGKLTVLPKGDIPNNSYTIIDIGSSIITGNFSSLDLPLGYSVKVNPSTVVLNYDDDIDDDGVKNINDCAPNDASKWRTGTFYKDTDGDTYTTGSAVTICYGATTPTGYAATQKGTDCDDNDATKWRTGTFYKDTDGDTYTTGSAVTICYGATTPAGYATTQKGTDCNDNNATVHPGAPEICGNGVDEDCDGVDGVCAPTDSDGDGVPDNIDCAPNDKAKWQSATLYIDADNDGYDNGQTSVCYGTTIPSGYKSSTLGKDCNDNNAAIHPGATDICGNGIDEDCDGKDAVCAPTDSDADGVPDNTDCAPNDANKWRSAEMYIDRDRDGYDNGKEIVCYGKDIPAGYISTSKGFDCNDNDATIHPGAEEICGDGKDNNCDGKVDEGVPTNGLIAYYPLDGNAKEMLGTTQGIDGLLVGVTPASNYKGIAGKALHFEDNQHVAIPDHDVFDLNNGDYSISLWVKYQASPDGYSMILTKGGYTTPGYQWFFNYPNQNEI